MANSKQDRYDTDGVDSGLGGSDEDDRANQSRSEAESKTDPTTGAASVTVEPDEPEEAAEEDTGSQAPHRFRCDSPKDERDRAVFFLGDEDIERINERKRLAEDEFDIKVYKIDVYLATFRSDGSEESFLEEMNRIGYGYFD